MISRGAKLLKNKTSHVTYLDKYSLTLCNIVYIDQAKFACFTFTRGNSPPMGKIAIFFSGSMKGRNQKRAYWSCAWTERVDYRGATKSSEKHLLRTIFCKVENKHSFNIWEIRKDWIIEELQKKLFNKRTDIQSGLKKSFALKKKVNVVFVKICPRHRTASSSHLLWTKL